MFKQGESSLHNSMASRNKDMQGAASYTLTIYFGGRFKPIEEDSRVYVGKKAIKHGWAIGFTYKDLIAMFGAEFEYKQNDEIFIKPPFSESEYAMIKVQSDKDIAFAISQLGGLGNILMFIVKHGDYTVEGEEFDDWYGDNVWVAELITPGVQDAITNGNTGEDKGDTVATEVGEMGQMEGESTDKDGDEDYDEEESDGISSFGAEEDEHTGDEFGEEVGDEIDGDRDDEVRQETGHAVENERNSRRGQTTENKMFDYAALVEELGADDEPGYGSEDLEGPSDSMQEKNAGGQFPEYRAGKGIQEPEEGMTYACVNTFRKAIQDWSIDQKYKLVWNKNDPNRSTLLCKMEGCEWKLIARQIVGEPTFQVRKIVGKHTCPKSHESSAMTVDWITQKILPKLRVQSSLTVEYLIDELKTTYQMKVSIWKVKKAKRKALAQINGENAKQFERLRDYGAELVKQNPDSIAVIKSELIGPSIRPTFQRFYVSYKAMYRGFIRGCRPFIALDGCHLKGVEGGQLLSAVTRDANNTLFPIAFAWVEAETKSSWKWFLEILNGNLDQNTKWTIMSDRQKGLMPAIEEVFPGSEQRSCVRHIYTNMVAQKWKGQLVRDKVWGAASAYTLHHHQYFMEELKKINYEAWEYLSEIPANTWARCHFQLHSKCDLVVNNISESWNKKILEARSLPIVTLCEWIRWKLMTEFQEKREKMGKYREIICPRIKKKLEKAASLGIDYIYGHAGPGVYEVIHRTGSRCTVELTKKTCTCWEWQMTGIPCSHAYGAIINERGDIEKYVDPCYFKDAYMMAYEDVIYPIPGSEQWMRLDCELLQPPVWRQPSGRPKKKRQRSASEPNPPRKVRRTGETQRCSKCKQTGHNARGCGKEPRGKNRSRSTTQPTQSTQGPSQVSEGPQANGGSSRVSEGPQANEGSSRVNEGPQANGGSSRVIGGPVAAVEGISRVTEAPVAAARASRATNSQNVGREKMPFRRPSVSGASERPRPAAEVASQASAGLSVSTSATLPKKPGMSTRPAQGSQTK